MKRMKKSRHKVAIYREKTIVIKIIENLFKLGILKVMELSYNNNLIMLIQACWISKKRIMIIFKRGRIGNFKLRERWFKQFFKAVEEDLSVKKIPQFAQSYYEIHFMYYCFSDGKVVYNNYGKIIQI